MSNTSEREITISVQCGISGSFFHSEMLKMDYSDSFGFSVLTYKHFSRSLSFPNNTSSLLGASVIFQCFPHAACLA